jgi:guanylate kinase
VGKTSFCTHLLETRSDCIRSVSATTRRIRPGEVDGRDYFFLTPEAFAARAEAGEFLEFADVHGHRYGTPRRFVDDQVAAGRVVLLNIDVQGGVQVNRYADAVAIFVWPPSLDALSAPEAAPGRRGRDRASPADAPGERAVRTLRLPVVNGRRRRCPVRRSSKGGTNASRAWCRRTLTHTEER